MIVVSDLFVDIYKNINISPQIERIKKLSKKELYLLLTCVIDNHSADDPMVRYNLLELRDEAMEIYSILNDGETTDWDLLQLMGETGDKYINTDNIVDSNGNRLPDPLNSVDVRDKRIDIIFGDILNGDS